MAGDRTVKIEQQHLRLLDGLAASIREKGLPQTHVSDVVRHARASRRTFYKHFPDKDSCVVELVQLNTANIMQAIATAIDLDAPRSTRIEQAIDAYLSILSGEPDLVLALASPSVGERIVQAQRDGLERFAEYLASLTTVASGHVAASREISVDRAYLLASGLRSAALRAIERGEGLDRLGAEGKAVFKAVLNGTD